MEEERTGNWRPMARVTNPESAGIGAGFGARQGPPPSQPQYNQPHRSAPPHHHLITGILHRYLREDTHPTGGHKSKLFCTHCGMTKHTKQTCFKLVRFPEWWEDGHKLNRNPMAKGKAALGREKDDGTTIPVGNQEATITGNGGKLTAETPARGGWWAAGGDVAEREGENRAAAAAHLGRTNEGIGFGNFFPNPPISPLSPLLPHYLHDKPPVIIHSKKRPQTVNFTKNHPICSKNITSAPKYKSSMIECKNRFSILENNPDISVSCHAKTMGVKNDRGWIFDCGATDTMTYDRADIKVLSKSSRTHVETASGELAPVEGE